jgi:hypothetical protein
MKINYEILKNYDCVKIYRNIDEFYKMHFECLIDNTFNDVNDLFQLSCNMQNIYSSYEHFKKQIVTNNIDNYIVICDFEHEKIYLCENMINDVIMYYVNIDCVFDDDFKIKRFENEHEKNRLIKSLFINFVYDIL